MVPMLTCGLVRSNFALATGAPPGFVTCYDSWVGVVQVPRIRRRGYSPRALLLVSLGASGPPPCCVACEVAWGGVVQVPSVRRRGYSPRTFLMISSAMFVGTSAYE